MPDFGEAFVSAYRGVRVSQRVDGRVTIHQTILRHGLPVASAPKEENANESHQPVVSSFNSPVAQSGNQRYAKQQDHQQNDGRYQAMIFRGCHADRLDGCHQLAWIGFLFDFLARLKDLNEEQVTYGLE